MKDFHAGLNEMASHAQGTVSAQVRRVLSVGLFAAHTNARQHTHTHTHTRTHAHTHARTHTPTVNMQELCERYRLPVFCVSAVDFQKLSGSRLSDGAPNVWEDVEDTEIPSLQRFFHENVLQKRFSRAHASMTALVNFCDMLESFLAPDTDETIGSADAAAVRQLAREAYLAEERRLNEAIAMHTANLDSKVERHFSGTIGPQLQVCLRVRIQPCMRDVCMYSYTNAHACVSVLVHANTYTMHVHLGWGAAGESPCHGHCAEMVERADQNALGDI